MGSVLVRRGRRWPLVVAGILALAAFLFTVLSGFLIDLLWYREIGQAGVFWTSIRTRVLLGIAFGLVFFIALVANLLIARRLTPEVRVLTPEEEALDRIRDLAEPYVRWLLPVASALIALLVGIRAGAHWQTFLLWSSSTGITFEGPPEALFDRNPAFYVFALPWMRYLQSWTFSALVGITVLTAAAHLYNGGIRPQARSWSDKVSPAVRAHLSVLIGLIMLSKAWGYYLGRFGLLTSLRGVVEGASYTDVNAQLPALTFLAIVAVICAVLFFVNVRVKLWSLPVIAVALLALTSLLLGAAYPAFVQRFRVDPQELQQEREYIDRNIAATRRAFGLDQIEEQPLASVSPTVSAEDLVADATTIANVRLWRPPILLENFDAEQRLEPYYTFEDVDVDRYDVGGETRLLMVSAREISQANIPGAGGTWQNVHLVYTHGYGVVGAQVNESEADGGPAYTIEDIPPDPGGVPFPARAQIYYGEREDVEFVVVGTRSDELDYEGAEAGSFAYDGRGGIRMSNAFVRALFAWRFRDVNLLISGQIGSDSRIMIHRDIADRATRAVPFLSFDSDPYLAVVDGQPTWIWDAYTTSTEYPYSQEVDLSEATGGVAQGVVANYLRNSVKATVDAYDGSVTYWADLDEPIILAWSRAFPGLFEDIDTAPPPLQAHFRYPENLFQVQSQQFANYHVVDATRFYNKQDFWQVPDDPTQEAFDTEGQVATPSDQPLPDLRPYYLILQVPGDSAERFQLVVPFVPGQAVSGSGGVPNMVAWMAANSDPEEYGKLVALTLPAGQNVDSPGLALSRIRADVEFSTQQTLLGRAGSRLIPGDLLVIPVGDGFLYVLPVFVRSTQRAAVPELKLVVVVNGGEVGVASTFAGALDQAVLGAEEPAPPGEEPPPPGEEPPVADDVRSLLSEALTHFAAAEEALRTGDLATYERELELAQGLVEQAQALVEERASA
jgi:uncharacterized membrane protein (UPF0182 family)